MSQLAGSALPKAFAPDPAAASALWFALRRDEALRRFELAGVPHRRVEEWKYSDLRNALEADGETCRLPSGSDLDPFARIEAYQLVVRDGRLDAPPSGANAPDGVEQYDLAMRDGDAPDWVRENLGNILPGNAMGHASLALMRGGVALRITRATDLPLHLRFLQNSDAAHCRVLIVIEPGASLVFLESHAGGRGFANVGAEIVLEANARLVHLRLAESAPCAIQVEEIGIGLARGARYSAHFSPAGAKLSRLELGIALRGEGAEAELSGATVLGRNLHADVTTHIDHIAGKTTSRQLFKYVVGGTARGIYQGKISVRKGADGSDSRQTAKALLAGARAEADLKPELEILADDVKCAHGAAVGELDADSLFYLRSRGLAEAEARALLTRAFLEESVAMIARDDLRAAVWAFTEHGLVAASDGEP